MISDFIKLLVDLVIVDWTKSASPANVKVTEFSLLTKLAIDCLFGLSLSLTISSISGDNKAWPSALILSFAGFIFFKFQRHKLSITKSLAITLLHTLAYALGVLLIVFIRSNT